MCRKSKYSQEMKIRVVKEYLSGNTVAYQLAKENGIGQETLRRWVANYQSMGVDGLAAKAVNAKYSAEMKRAAAEEYLSGKHSLYELQKKYKVRSDHQLRQWVQCYNSHRDFKQPNSGGAIYMAQGRSTTLNERIEIVSHCIAHNKDYGETIERYGVSYNQVYGWVRKYEESGLDGLIDRRGKRKDESCMTEVEKLRAQLKLRDAENRRLQMENDLLKKLEALERGRDED